MRNLVAMRQMKTKLRCLKPHRPYTVDFAIGARESVNRRVAGQNAGSFVLKPIYPEATAFCFPFS